MPFTYHGILLDQLVGAIGASIAGVGYLTLLMLTVIYIYAVLGTQLFGKASLDGRASFQNLPNSMLTVFIIITGEGWATIMQECRGDLLGVTGHGKNFFRPFRFFNAKIPDKNWVSSRFRHRPSKDIRKTFDTTFSPSDP
eukprot:gene18184-812_t